MRKRSKHTEESKAKQRAAKLGKKHTPESRAKMRANCVGMTGRKHTEESKAKMRASHLGKTLPLEQRAKIGAALKGREISPEHRANVSAALKGRSLPAAHRAKLAAAHLGLKHTTATRAKMSRSHVVQIQAAGRLATAGRYKFGWFFSKKMGRKIWYRSSYEKKAYEMLDTSPIIKAFRAEPFIIPYQFEGRDCNYLPDLEVEFVGGEKRLVEIKPKALLSDKTNVAKFRAARTFAELNGYAQFNVWTERTLF